MRLVEAKTTTMMTERGLNNASHGATNALGGCTRYEPVLTFQTGGYQRGGRKGFISHTWQFMAHRQQA
jgi:hypothetical protein